MGNLTLSTTEYVTPFYYDGDTANPGYGAIAVMLTDANYISGTNKIRIAYTVELRRKPKSSGYYGYTYYTAGYASIGGVEIYNAHASTGSWLKQSWNNGEDLATGTVDIDASKGTTQSIAVYAKGMFNYGYNETRWNDNTGCTSGSVNTTTPVPGDPSISISITSSTAASRGGSNGKATATASGMSAGTNGGNYSYSLTNNGNTVNNTASKEATGLKNNTSYAYSASISNTFGLSKSVSSTYYLTPVKPGLSVSASPARTSATLTLSASYDTNRKAGSTSIRYGTSTNYGSTASSGSLSNLAANTTYYYSAAVTDANNGGPYASALTSDAVTGSFTTTGNAPTITSVSASPSRTSAALSVSTTFDTNASASSYSVRYGTTQSYGSTSSNTTLSGLAANTTYYYSVTVTDNFGRTSDAKTGSFTTTGNAPTISSVSASPSRTGATISASVSYDTNASYSSISIQYGTSTSYGSTSNSTSLSSLTPNTTYYYSVKVTDNFGRQSAAKTGSFTTTGNGPSVSVTSVTPGVFGCDFTYSATYDTGASFGSLSIRYGTTQSYGSTSSSASLTGLSPETTYYYSLTVTDNKGYTSNAVTGSFTTLVDQAKARIKTASGWVQGKVWIKTAGGWVKAKKAYIKTASGWKEGV